MNKLIFDAHVFILLRKKKQNKEIKYKLEPSVIRVLELKLWKIYVNNFIFS